MAVPYTTCVYCVLLSCLLMNDFLAYIVGKPAVCSHIVPTQKVDVASSMLLLTSAPVVEASV